jgi:signal transduction histidine kinase
VSWVDVTWFMFVGLNLVAMRLLPEWQTIPFLIIWVSLTVIYGFRLWRLGSTIATVTLVTLATGGLIGSQVLRGQEDGAYLAEVPLLAMMFVAMVWHARRRLAAMEETKRVSEQNLYLLEQQRRFLQDASHELRTPITSALGHTQLIEQAATDPMIAEDARVAVDELLRLARLANRLLLLAASESPDFLEMAPVDACELAFDTTSRWSHTARRWSIGTLDDVTIHGDRDRLTVALDALVENAVDHTGEGDRIELSVRLDGSDVVLSVTDSGSGIPATELGRIFRRFARVDPDRTRKAGGFGLGLAVVDAIAEAHHGSVRVRSTVGEGSAFELRLPIAATGLAPTIPDSSRSAELVPGEPPEAAARHPVVTLQYFEGCPNWHTALDRLRQALRDEGLADVEPVLERVETPEEAERLHFIGSPTVLVDGRDSFAGPASAYGLTCRVYSTPEGLAGSPTLDQLRASLR